MRWLTTLFGATTLATTATLSGFFLGLAAGSHTFGRRAARWRRPVRAFGLLEIGVALGALVVPAVLAAYRMAYPSLYSWLAPFPAGFAVVKLLLAVAAVGIPAFCMGGTLPALAEAIASPGRSLGIPVGGLYAMNLLGATAGTLAVPFVLLPRLGLDASYACAIAGSLVIGLTAFFVGPAAAERPLAGGSSSPSSTSASLVSPSTSTFAVVLSAVSGLCALALQVLWTRMFALVHENSLYSFAVVVSVFLLGLTGGAALARLALARGLEPRRLLGRAWCAAGLLVVVSPPLFHVMTGGLAFVSTGSWPATLGRLLGLALVTTFPACVTLGMALPLVLDIASPVGRAPAGPVVGRVVAANTLGAIAGPLLATFVLGPLLGLWWSLVVLGSLLVVAGAVTGLPRAEAVLGGGALATLVVLLAPAGLPPVRIAPGQRLVSVREGTHGTTAVLADEHDRWITVNNSYVLGGTAASDEERWQAHLPLLLHPAPRRVAFVGMGTGITAGAALLHPVDHIVALEIVPEVVAAARADFADANARLLEDPRVTVVIDDGRNFVASSARGFDVIVGDLLVPWRPGEAALYTQEHFASVRRALSDDGLFCQWLPLYQLSADQLAVVVRTFVEVFPAASLWRGNFVPDAPTLALVGHLGSRPLDTAAIDARLHALAATADANPFLKHPAGMWVFFVGPLTAGHSWVARAPTNRDGAPWVELWSPRAMAGRDLVAAETFLDEVAAGALEGTPFAGLDETHRGWRATGADLSRAARTRGPDGERRVLAILKTLPPELQRALEVDPSR
jgi:spermidine synthase